jgi:proteasome lid subunit RPN8/RPN11
MFSRVKVRKGALDYFRKLSRQSYPLEIQAFLIGKVNSVDEIEITRFVYPKNYHTQTHCEVCWNDDEFTELKEKVLKNGERIVGDCHTHPDYEPILSSVDYQGFITEGLLVCGVVSVNNNKTRVRFWTASSALPCKIHLV